MQQQCSGRVSPGQPPHLEASNLPQPSSAVDAKYNKLYYCVIVYVSKANSQAKPQFSSYRCWKARGSSSTATLTKAIQRHENTTIYVWKYQLAFPIIHLNLKIPAGLSHAVRLMSALLLLSVVWFSRGGVWREGWRERRLDISNHR